MYIDRGKEAGGENEAIFDQLHAKKEEIEQAFGGRLKWERLEGRRACRISKEIHAGGYRDEEEKWPDIQDAMIDAMIRLERALNAHITQLEI